MLSYDVLDPCSNIRFINLFFGDFCENDANRVHQRLELILEHFIQPLERLNYELTFTGFEGGVINNKNYLDRTAFYKNLGIRI